LAGTLGYKQGANIKKAITSSVFSRVSKFGLFQEFKKLLCEIERNETVESSLRDALRKRKEELDQNLERIISEKKFKMKSYKAFKWISFQYCAIKSQIKNAFEEWTVSKKKGEQFE